MTDISNTTSSANTSSTSRDSSSQREGEDTRSSVQERVTDAARDVAGQAKRQAESVYRGAASAATGTSEAIGDVADALEGSGHETLSQAAAALAERVRTLSRYLEDRRLEDLIGDARTLARRNPGLFIAGGVALGFALSRLLKASSADASRATTNVS